jgi:hypothetical protein
MYGIGVLARLPVHVRALPPVTLSHDVVHRLIVGVNGTSCIVPPRFGQKADT